MLLWPVTIWAVEWDGVIIVFDDQGSVLAWLAKLSPEVNCQVRAWQM